MPASISPETLNRVGKKFGKLFIVALLPQERGKKREYLTTCDCETTKAVPVSMIARGVKSCLDCAKKKSITHGMRKTKTYRTWHSMKQRCTNKHSPDYDNYGGRGIKIAGAWMDFESFYKDMGETPPGKTLERVNNNGNYEPGNCEWKTRKEQNNNRRSSRYLTWNSRTQTMAQWADERGIKLATLWLRLKNGKSVEEALTEPTRPQRKR